MYKTICERYNEPYKKMKPIGIKHTYQIGPKLGTGGFAVVRKCRQKSTNQNYALKVVNKKNMDKNDLLLLESEINFMRICSHPHIGY